ncbi:MAG: helicase RepA family protein [Rhodoferax sp.]|nr:helicase RepA family protein [Rhodoferax sp.]
MNTTSREKREADFDEAYRETRAASTPKVYTSLSCADLMALPRPEWRVQNILTEQGLAFVYGASRSGKTFLVLDLAFAIARGVPWFGFKTMKSHVFYAPLEAGKGIRNRVEAWLLKNKMVDVPNFHVQAEFQLALDDDLDIEALAAWVIKDGEPGSVVIIDTFARATAGLDENSTAAMGPVIAAADRLASRVRGLVILVHHTGKVIGKGPRGSSALTGAADSMIEVTHSDSGVRQWKADKVKEGQDGMTFTFKLDRVPLYVDDFGGEVSSCVIVPDTEADEARREDRRVQGKNQKVVLDAIFVALESATIGVEGAPPDVPALTFEQATQAGVQMMDRGETKTDRRPEMVRKVIGGLVAKGLLLQGENHHVGGPRLRKVGEPVPLPAKVVIWRPRRAAGRG